MASTQDGSAGEVRRIGEVSRRVGVSPALLRVWEARYGVPQPGRTSGGLRLYSEADEGQIRAMRDRIAGGLSAAEAAQSVMRERRDQSVTVAPEDVTRSLEEALDRFDDAAAQDHLDRAFAAYGIPTVVQWVIMPYLRRLGERWAGGDVTVAHEHFASNLLRSRLLALARGWDQGLGPHAVLSCPPGERHDIGLICFGLALRAHGWRIAYLGQDTPIDALQASIASLQPKALVLAAIDAERYTTINSDLEQLARSTTLWLGGAGAPAGTPLPGRRLAGDLVIAAGVVASA